MCSASLENHTRVRRIRVGAQLCRALALQFTEQTWHLAYQTEWLCVAWGLSLTRLNSFSSQSVDMCLRWRPNSHCVYHSTWPDLCCGPPCGKHPIVPEAFNLLIYFHNCTTPLTQTSGMDLTERVPWSKSEWVKYHLFTQVLSCPTHVQWFRHTWLLSSWITTHQLRTSTPVSSLLSVQETFLRINPVQLLPKPVTTLNSGLTVKMKPEGIPHHDSPTPDYSPHTGIIVFL